MENNRWDKLSTPITPEQIAKTDNDLETIKSLNAYAERSGAILVLSGGYATEALCGGKITRPHGDIDVHFLLDEVGDSTQQFSTLGAEVVFKEQTKWINFKQTETKVEFREEDDTKSFFDRRRLELTLHKKGDASLYVPSFLISSQGERIEVYVVEINELLASKIHKFYSLKDGIDTSKDRHTDDRDIYDLKRLLNSPDVDKDKMLKILAGRHIKTSESGDLEGQAKAEYDYILGLYK